MAGPPTCSPVKIIVGVVSEQTATRTAARLSVTPFAFHPSTLTYWRRRLAASDRPNRIFDAVRAVVAETGAVTAKTRRALDSHPATRSRPGPRQTERAALFDGLIQRAETATEAADHVRDPHPVRRRGRVRRTAHLPRRLASGSQRQTLADSLTAFVGHDAYGVDELHHDLDRFVFLLGLSDGEHLFGESTP
jgi:hypothetical protein